MELGTSEDSEWYEIDHCYVMILLLNDSLIFEYSQLRRLTVGHTVKSSKKKCTVHVGHPHS